MMNYPPGETSGRNRYNRVLISGASATEIANNSNTNYIDFGLVCGTPSDQDYGWGKGVCHSNVTWVQVKKDGVLIFNGCPQGNFLKVDPCTGQIITN
jgi:hypothetical protein